MKNTCKRYLEQLNNWTMPPHLQRLAVNVWRWFQKHLLTDKEVSLKVKNNVRFKNMHKDEDVFILCTGSSINNYDLLKLKGKKCIAVSYFSLYEHYQELAIDYHILAPSHPPLDFKHAEKMFSAFKEHECLDTTFFLGHMNYQYSYLNYLRKHPEMKPNNLEFLCYDGSPTLNDYNYKSSSIWNISGRPFIMNTGLYGTLQLAAYMGFKRIYLLGVDHDFINTVKQVTKHFFEPEKGTDDSADHGSSQLENVFANLHITFHHYVLMKEYLQSKNIQIINLTKESQLDMFEKQDFNDVVV